MKIQLTFDKDGEKLVASLLKWIGAKTYMDLFNNALTLLDWAIRQRTQGRIIASLDEKSQTYRELLMPCLQKAASLAEAEIAQAQRGANVASAPIRTAGSS
jgi:hypothetical protein